MLALDRRKNDFLYQQVIDLIKMEIDSGALTPGDRLPSLRRLAGNLDVSIPTVKQAYEELERLGQVESRPQSGFYVLARVRNGLVRPPESAPNGPVEVSCRELVEQVYEGMHQPGVIPLGIANPSFARPTAKALHRTMKRVMARAEQRSVGYAPVRGEPGLQRQIAFRYLDLGGAVRPQDITITNGCQEALALALQAVARRGDVIAVESPTYSGTLELIESLGMLALEIETCPTKGLCLDALETALGRQSVRACVFSSCLNNPLGSATSDGHRQALVELVESFNVPLIEDDVYGDLLFDGRRHKPAQFFSSKGLVLTAGSFSKTAAPGYRIGWLMPGRFSDQVFKLKRAISYSSGLLQQLTLAEFMGSGEYDRHLKKLRPVLKLNCERMTALVAESFPAETRISQPAGGSVLWLEMDPGFDSGEYFHRALAEGISVAPGAIFSPGNRFRHFLRLSFGHPWGEPLENAIQTLGALAKGNAGRG
ncbi:MAG: PLP-dependent aminotransferase family protein [Lysobacterales bacterium]